MKEIETKVLEVDVREVIKKLNNLGAEKIIEANSEKKINNMIKKLNLEKYETWNDGERILIENKYKLKWSNMRF